jgi:hypothetical protein
VLESFNTNDSNSIITNYYQCGPFTIKDSVIIEILMVKNLISLHHDLPFYNRHYENVSEKDPISADEGTTKRERRYNITKNNNKTKHKNNEE